MTEDENRRVFAVVKGEVRSTGEKPANSYIEALMHLCKSYVGTGIYAMPKALSYSGYGFGPIMTAFIAFIDLHCQHILVKTSVKIAMKEPDGERIFPTFDETVKYSFIDSPYAFLQKSAGFMATLTNVFLAIGQSGFCIAYMVFIAEHVVMILKSTCEWEPPYRVILAIIFLPVWMSTFLGSLRLLTPINLFANVLIWVGIGLVLYYCTSNMKHIADLHVINVMDLPLFFGIIMFAFQNIGLVLPLRSEVRNVHQYTSLLGILNMGMLFVVSLYVFLGLVGYWKYGEKVEGSVFLNLPEEPLAQATQGVISVSVLCSFALQFYILIEIIYPNFYFKYGPFRSNYLVLSVYRTVAVLIIYIFANISKKIDLVIALVGSIAGSYTCIILPALLEISLGELSRAVFIKDILLMIFGLAGAITGTAQSITEIAREIINATKTSQNHTN